MMVGRKGRPRILILADEHNWAYDFDAKSLKKWLVPRYDITIRYAMREPDLSKENFDLLYVLFYGDEHHRRFGIPADKIIKQVSSHRWAYDEKQGKLSVKAMAKRYLEDCKVVTTSSRRLLQMFQPVRQHVYYCPHGVEVDSFKYRGRRTGPLTLGWVGHPGDFLKGLDEILIPACEGRFNLRYTDGSWSHRRVRRLYRELDVLAISSIAEGDPRPLIEGLLCGCFPVATDVGIVPELVNSGYNGLVVERSVEAFREAFEWCERNVDQIRRVAPYNSRMCAAVRSAEHVAGRTGDIFDLALGIRTTVAPDIGMDLNAAAEGPHTHESVLETSNAYVNKATRLERQILPLLPGSRESAIADATTHRSELVRFLLENGYRNVRSVDFPKNGSDRASGDARRYRPADLDSAGDLDAFVVLDVDDQASGEHLRDMIGAAYSALRTDGRIILHCNALGNNGRLTEMSRRLIELLKNAGFSDTGVHAPAGPVTTLEGMRRMASLLLSRGNAESNEAWHQDLVTWATKGQS